MNVTTIYFPNFKPFSRLFFSKTIAMERRVLYKGIGMKYIEHIIANVSSEPYNTNFRGSLPDPVLRRD